MLQASGELLASSCLTAVAEEQHRGNHGFG